MSEGFFTSLAFFYFKKNNMVNVNEVYESVLYILNKEQTGHITPEEFNSFASQVQLQIFNSYFADASMYSKRPEESGEYTSREDLLTQKLEPFKVYNSTVYGLNGVFNLSETDRNTIHYIDNITVTSTTDSSIYVVDKVSYREFTLMNMSPLVKPDNAHPVYYTSNSGNKITISPGYGSASIDYVKKPIDPEWKYSLNTLGIPVHSTSSVDFELHASEKISLIVGILALCGIVIKDPSVLQITGNIGQGIEQNKLK